ncbi:MAG: hypothetical protein JWM78_1662 [Verrucomicrobiaceae bacterium]|nr:hypothetical protein [Verrucomicrobiaceae bacterium]
MTVTINFTASQNPFVDARITQSNPASSLVDSSSILNQIAASTENFLLYNGATDKNQSVTATVKLAVNESDYYNIGVEGGLDLRVLYTDANNYCRTEIENNGADAKTMYILSVIAGVEAVIATYSGLADAFFTDNIAWTLDVAWTGANASFSLKKNGTNVGAPVTKTSFALTAGKPGYNIIAGAGGGTPRSVRASQIVITGDSVSDTTAPSATAGPTVSNANASGFDIGATADEAGTAFLIYLSDINAAQPSDATFDASTEKATMVASTPFSIHHTGG